MSGRKCKVEGAESNSRKVLIIEQVQVKGNFREGCMDMLYMLNLDSNLLGQYLQVQLNMGVVPEEGRMVTKMLVLKQEDERGIDPRVWSEEGVRDY